MAGGGTEKLFMVEVMISKIVFDDLPVPLKRDIIITATWGTLPSMEIRTDIMGALANLETKERSSKRKDVEIDCGRSVMFPIPPAKMLDALKEPMELEVSRRTNETVVGTVAIKWNADFSDMVESCQMSSGYVTPVYVESTYVLNDADKQFAGTIDAYIRLTFLGQHVFTNIQRMRATEGPAQFLFKSTDNATIFKCLRHGEGSDSEVMPISAAYAIADGGGGGRVLAKKSQRTKSTETLMKMQMVGSTTSIMPSVFVGLGPQDRRAIINTLVPDDGRSMMSMGALKVTNYIDFAALKANVSTFSNIQTSFGLHALSANDQSGFDIEGGEDGPAPIIFNYKALTVDEIEKRLCCHPDCPAAKLFKDYGIGPLAKNFSGLGGLYKDVDAPCTYGMSHCNGTIDGYGPLGRFKRPKRAEEPFSAKGNCKCAEKSPSVTSSTKSGSKKKSRCYEHCPEQEQKAQTLRLKGGAPGHTSAPCNPIDPSPTVFQDLMDEFNKVLKDYKDLLGPCQEATCPFALNLIEDECRNICSGGDPYTVRDICNLTNPDATWKEKDEFAACGAATCPYKRPTINPTDLEYSKYQGMPGCGYTTCPFVRAKLGLEIDEDTHLPPVQDYRKQKLYKFTDALPPIHWDCPDPLPKGDCKNPDCPFVKRDALIKKYFPDPCCACGNPACPYVTAPCTFPGCPFGIAEPCPPVCPYTEPPPKELQCTPSICPLVRIAENQCETPDCPYRKYEEKLDDYAKHMELRMREAEEDEEDAEDSSCKPCGRSKYGRSTSRSSRTGTLPSKTTFSMTETPQTASQADKADANIRKSDGGGSRVSYEVDKEQKSKEQIRVSTDISESKAIPSTEDSNKIVAINAPQSDKKTTPKKETSRRRNKEEKEHMVSTATVLKRRGILAEQSKKCRKQHFLFDKKSFKPCNKIGHRECVLPKFIVPKNMGWLWNIHNNICGLKPRLGWKPGAISKSIALRIDYLNALREKRPLKMINSQLEHALDMKPSKPTINVHKQGGIVDVTMLPIKEPAEVKWAGDGNPYMKCSPIEFQIKKNEPPGKQKKLCFCGEEISSTSSSELEFEFSPPAALKNPRLISKHGISESEAQYNINDVALPPPPPPKKGPWLNWRYWKLHVEWCSSQILWSIDYLRITIISKSFLQNADAPKGSQPLRLRGGGRPPAKINFPNPRVICKDLLDDYDRVMKEYKKALGPCGKSICPMSWNVVEASCRQVCAVQNVVHEEPKDIYSFPEESEEPYDGYQVPDIYGNSKNRTECNEKISSESVDSTTLPTNSKKKEPAIKCEPHSCPFKADELTVDDMISGKRKIKPKKGCGSPFCPHVIKPVQEEVQMPKFPCIGPCPSIEELPPIHWDCPDPLPKGECTNPNCPLRDKLPCGHCPIDEHHCGYQGCPWAGDNICPPTCPYSEKRTPKHLDCTPSVCPLVRPCGYRPRKLISRKDKPCGDRCPYAKGNVLKQACTNPTCPYRTCADTEDANMDMCNNPDCPYRLAKKKLEARKVESAIPVSNVNVSAIRIDEPKVSQTRSESVPSKGSLSTTNTNPIDTATSKKRSKSALKTAQASMSHLLSQLEAEANPDTACTTDTCAAYSGARLCKKCAQVENKPLPIKKKKKKRKKQWGYVYDKGTYYPGVKFGHKDCSCLADRVPWDMGWMWNIPDQSMNMKPRHGWSPGAIGKTILHMINKERKRLGLPPRPMVRHPFPATSHRMFGDHKPEHFGKRGRYRGSFEHVVVPKPVLSVKKKDGIVYVAMNPLKDPADMEDGEYPYLDCAPIEFKIIRNKPKEKLECACDEDAQSTASSELDIEFTPPAGIVRTSPFGKHICHTETQYNEKDVFREPSDQSKTKSKKGDKQKKKGGKKGKK